MASRALLPILVLLVAGLAACTQPPAAPPAPVGAPGHLSLTGCSGWHASIGPLPPALVPGAAPAGWEPPPENLPHVRLDGFECERLGLGPFERGPVHLVVDSHTRATFPAACYPSDFAVTGLVGTLWVDDDGLARYLAETYGLPARRASVLPESDGTGSAQAHAWTWTDAEGRSTATVPSGVPSQVANRPSLLLWPAGDGIGSLSLTFQDRTVPVGPELAVSGTAQPPALLSALPGGAFAGQGYWSDGFSAEGTFKAYRDTMCTQPEGEA
jgi:hypothetical protein